MNEVLLNKANIAYEKAEREAISYYSSLLRELRNKNYVKNLSKRMEVWKINHRDIRVFNTLMPNKIMEKPPKDYEKYIKWLDNRGTLEDYLDRSIAYIYMRDLGKSIEDEEVVLKVKDTVKGLKDSLIKEVYGENKELGVRDLYVMAKEEGIELTLIWLINKLSDVWRNMPDAINKNHGLRKVIKIVAGVLTHELEILKDNDNKEERKEALIKALKLGYAYGLTYPFIDDLLDARILTKEEEIQYSNIIKETLVTGVVPALESIDGPNKDLIKYIHGELGEGFRYIKSQHDSESLEDFLNLSYTFYKSQEIDRKKEINEVYKPMDIFIPIILKSSSSRLIVRSVLNDKGTLDEVKRLFVYGIYNQLADDFTDIFEDLESDRLTPYTYYLRNYKKIEDIINPFELYLVVINYLIEDIFNGHDKSGDILLSRAINSLKRFKSKLSKEKYKEIKDCFFPKDKKITKLIESLVNSTVEVNFFDKLLRDKIIDSLEKEREEAHNFSDGVKEVRDKINEKLFITKGEKYNLNEKIIEAANYIIKGDGKRIRPIIAYFMGKSYDIGEEKVMPLLKSLEYMHSASLILDDLPSQDNASMRRGKRTVHEVYDIATAELTSMFLTQEGIKEQSLLSRYFKSEVVLEVIAYCSETIKIMCLGQHMDLSSRGVKLTLEQLKDLCFYKTGIGFEASLVMPAILSGQDKKEIESLKLFAKYAGIAFQIKDDMLDVTGNLNKLGKREGIDKRNNNSTFVSILGYEMAERELWENYTLAMEALDYIKGNKKFLSQLMNYILNREK